MMTLEQILGTWGGTSYPAYDGQANTAVPAAPPAATTPAGTGAPASGSPTGAGDGGPKPGASSTPTDANAENLRQLREGYESYSKLGKPDELATSHQVYTNLHKTWLESATKLGYDAADFAKAFAADPVKTIDVLRREAAAARTQQPRGQGNVEDLVKKHIDDALKPFHEQQNIAKTNEANSVFDKETNTLVSTDFKDHPQEVKDFLYDMTSELLKMDEASIKELKFEGKTAGVKKAYAEAKDIFLRVVTAYNAHETKVRGGAGAAAAGTGGGEGADKLSLDDIVNATPKAAKRIASFR
jgi:hypothetical protein